MAESVTICPSCAFAAAPDFAFCPRCGTRLGPTPAPAASSPATATRPEPVRPASVATEADRRTVSVLFADVAGFTTLSERLDPEDVRGFQDDLFRELRSAIERYGGFVEKFVGDAVMATFGAPVAHEDDPERALHAALALHQGMTEVNRAWQERLGRPLALHVGINTGPVVAGTLGAAADGAYAVTGDTVNTAARLQGAAAPGQTLVARATYLLTQHAFDFESVGELQLKGRAEPVVVFGLLGALASPGSRRGLEAHGLAAPLVGRDEELSAMLAAFERAAGGQAEVVSLVGEAGIGKSRLLDEFMARLVSAGRLRHATVRRAGCASTGERTYGVLAAFFREGYGIAPSDPPESVRQKVAAGLEGLGAGEDERARIVRLAGYLLGLEGDPLAAHLDPEQLRRQIFLGMRVLFERRLARGPLILLVEDLHWADAASVELLCFLADRLADRPLLLVFTHRPAPELGALPTGRAKHTALRLGTLPVGDAQALLGALFGASADALPAALGELVVRRAGGNPFYLEEIVRGLISEGVLVRKDGRWACRADVGPADVPLTVQGLILSRLDRLPPEARRVAQEASILGPEFESRILRLVAADAACEGALALLEDAGLMRALSAPAADGSGVPGEARRYAFSHALVQETIYQNLLIRRRTELHGRVAALLESLGGCDEGSARLEDLETLGRHWSLSAEKLKGARYLTRAGDWARGMYANADAIRHYERALRILEECDPSVRERPAIEERLADVLALTGRREAARQRYDAVRRAGEAAGNPPAQARVCRKLAALYWDAGERDQALEWLRSGLAVLGDVDHIEAAHLYQEMGRLAFRSGDNQRAIEWTDRALAQAERLPVAAGAGPAEPTSDDSWERTSALSHAYNTRGVALARLGRLEEAVAEIERSVEIARTHDLLQVACRGYANLGVLYSTLDPGRAIETCRSGLDIAKRIGDLGFQSRLYANLAVAYCALTNRCDDDGVAAAQAAIELDRQLGQLDHLAVPLIVLGQIYQCHGEPEQARRHYLEALSLAEQAGEPQLLFPCYDGLATLHLDLGDEARAEEYMRRAQEVCERAGVEPDALMVLPFLC
jgi:predicted ATPase/class 3 adenylate cyclase